TSVDARMGDDQDRRLAGICERALDLVPGRRVDALEVVLELRAPERPVLELQLGVTQDQGTTALLNEVDHGPKGRLFRVVATAEPPQHKALRDEQVVEGDVGGLEIRADDRRAAHKDVHSTPPETCPRRGRTGEQADRRRVAMARAGLPITRAGRLLRG